MALRAYGRQEVFDAVKARIAAASGVAYDDRMSVGTMPTGRSSYFVIGPRRTSQDSRDRGQDRDHKMMRTEFPCELAYLFKPHQRETSREEIDTLADRMQRKVNVNTDGLETEWLADDEVEVPSGEWLVIRFRVAASYLFDLGG